MTKNDEKKFAIFMAMLGTAFEKGGLTKSRIDMYFKFLCDIAIEDIDRAVREIIGNRKFPTFPTIGEIRDAAVGNDEQAQDEAMGAWSQAARLIATGRRSDDPVLNEAIRLAFGSWQMFGQTDPDMDAADRAHFIRCFRSIDRRRRRELLMVGRTRAPKQLNEGGGET